MPKLNQDNMQEFICEIIEHFEDFLDAKSIELDNPEKQEAIKDGVADEECICNIYGTDYGWLADDIKSTLEHWKLITIKKKKVIQRKEQYPLNLVHAVKEGFEWGQTPDQIAGLEYALTDLADKERECIVLYFQNRMTYREIGDIYHLSTERIRQIVKKAERKLRHPSRFDYIRYGYEGNIERLTPKYELTEEERLVDLLDTPIEEMNLSVRAFNCLKRGNINTVSDITEGLKKDDIMKIRNMGPKTYEEIIQIVAPYYGMTVLEYLDFLTSEGETNEH